jgi:ribonucleoside-triphosphate reductase
MDLFNYTISGLQERRGRKLNSDEVHGIICKIGDIVVVGGVRRSALISLFNPSDERMLIAKTGQFPLIFIWLTTRLLGPRSLMLSASCISGRPWWSPSPASRGSSTGKRQNGSESIGRDSDYEFGTNPCGEIILRDMQFCNLTEVTVRADDTLETLRRKVRSPLFWARSSPLHGISLSR